jgi:hypothetical protein
MIKEEPNSGLQDGNAWLRPPKQAKTLDNQTENLDLNLKTDQN